MKKIRLVLAMILVFGLLLSLTGCKMLGNDTYTVVERLENQKLCVAFRFGDKAGDAVIAALSELEAEGEVESISHKWFGEDRSLLKGDENALASLESPAEPRTFIVGFDPAHLPFSGGSASSPTGFDVELARKVCEKLGWKIKFVAVDVSKAEVELASGNVDCVWGAYAYDEGSTKLSQSPVYMENTVIVASLNGSGIRTEKSLSGKTLAVSEAGLYSSVLDRHSDISDRAEFLVKLPGGPDACFDALESGACDAIVTDLASIEYHK